MGRRGEGLLRGRGPRLRVHPKERYQSYFLNELPERYHPLFDHRRAGSGERLVFEPYTKEVFDRPHRWMLDWQIFPQGQVSHVTYEQAVAV